MQVISKETVVINGCKVLITYSEKSENNTLSDVKRILFDRYASTKMVRKFDK